MQSQVVSLGKKVGGKDSQLDNKKGTEEFNSEYKRLANFTNPQSHVKFDEQISYYEK